jgi:hypothetical protein
MYDAMSNTVLRFKSQKPLSLEYYTFINKLVVRQTLLCINIDKFDWMAWRLIHAVFVINLYIKLFIYYLLSTLSKWS